MCILEGFVRKEISETKRELLIRWALDPHDEKSFTFLEGRIEALWSVLDHLQGKGEDRP